MTFLEQIANGADGAAKSNVGRPVKISVSQRVWREVVDQERADPAIGLQTATGLSVVYADCLPDWAGAVSMTNGAVVLVDLGTGRVVRRHPAP